jgi:mono/diheme cytochrome c family protein
MNRFFVPAILVATISGLALTLIVGIVMRSPYTHGNLSSTAGYTRTKVTYIGQTYTFEGMPLARPADAKTGDPVHDGQLLFFQYGCASCHMSGGQGGAVGKDIAGDSANKIETKVRNGPKGMPQFTSDMLPDADLQKIIAFLQAQPQQ